MIRYWPIVPFGAGIAAVLYGTLLALTQAATIPEDPWAASFSEAGFHVQLLSTSKKPNRWFYVVERHDELKPAPYADTELREYLIEGFKMQVAIFPKGADMDPIVPAGVHKNFKPKPAQEKFYYTCRVGRFVLVTRFAEGGMKGSSQRLSGKEMARVVEAFTRVAESHENPEN